MGYELRPGLSFCDTGSQIIFLDLAQDRYFQLPRTLADAFRTFADPARYAEAAIEDLLVAGIVRPSAALRRPEPARVSRAASRFESHGDATALNIARALSSDMLISWQLRRGRLARLVAALRNQKFARPMPQTITDRGPRAILSSYAAARLYRSPAGRCLSGSIAMVQHLSGIGCASTLVIGVRAEPFAAHSWVQADQVVLNDTSEEVSRFTPIFAV